MFSIQNLILNTYYNQLQQSFPVGEILFARQNEHED